VSQSSWVVEPKSGLCDIPQLTGAGTCEGIVSRILVVSTAGMGPVQKLGHLRDVPCPQLAVNLSAFATLADKLTLSAAVVSSALDDSSGC